MTGGLRKGMAVAGVLLAMGCTSGGGAPDVDGGPASDAATLFKASNLSKVLDKVKSNLGSTAVSTVKIEPKDVKAVGASRVVVVDVNDKKSTVNTPAIPGIPTFDISAVDPAGVEKAVTGTESAASVKQADISYVAVSQNPVTSKATLGVYIRNSADYYSADLDGSNVKKGGTGSASTGGAGIPSSGSSGSVSVPAAPSGGAGSSGGSMSDCIAKAGNDATKLQACAGH